MGITDDLELLGLGPGPLEKKVRHWRKGKGTKLHSPHGWREGRTACNLQTSSCVEVQVAPLDEGSACAKCTRVEPDQAREYHDTVSALAAWSRCLEEVAGRLGAGATLPDDAVCLTAAEQSFRAAAAPQWMREADRDGWWLPVELTLEAIADRHATVIGDVCRACAATRDAELEVALTRSVLRAECQYREYYQPDRDVGLVKMVNHQLQRVAVGWIETTEGGTIALEGGRRRVFDELRNHDTTSVSAIRTPRFSGADFPTPQAWADAERAAELETVTAHLCERWETRAREVAALADAPPVVIAGDRWAFDQRLQERLWSRVDVRIARRFTHERRVAFELSALEAEWFCAPVRDYHLSVFNMGAAEDLDDEVIQAFLTLWDPHRGVDPNETLRTARALTV